MNSIYKQKVTNNNSPVKALNNMGMTNNALRPI
jgi:hypothetical protein